MFRQSIIIILLLLTIVIAVSGCTTKTATNGTFGEKTISIDSIFISNNTTAATENKNGTEYYYIQGYLENNNSNDSFNVKINATVYDAKGNVVATNNSAYLNPPTIPAKGISFLFIKFKDPNQTIVRYDVKVVNAEGIV